MNPAEGRINKLSLRRSELKQAGNYREAIPLQLEIIELLEESATPRERLASEHNYASVLYLRCALYSTAELHARHALSLSSGETPRGVEARGCFHMVLAQILAAQYWFEDALPYGENAIRDYGVFHNPPDEFLERIADEVERIRNRTWSPPPD